MTDAERIERLEFLLESAEKMVNTHLQARLRAEESLQTLATSMSRDELRMRIQQLETQLYFCHQATLKGKDADARLKDLRPEDYIYSQALEQILFLYEWRNPILMVASYSDEAVPEQSVATYSSDEPAPEQKP